MAMLIRPGDAAYPGPSQDPAGRGYLYAGGGGTTKERIMPGDPGYDRKLDPKGNGYPNPEYNGPAAGLQAAAPVAPTAPTPATGPVPVATPPAATPPTTPSPAPIPPSEPPPALAPGGGGMPSSALAGLKETGPAAGPAPMSEPVFSGGGPTISAPGMLRQGIGTRIPPQLSTALAGLRRIY